MNIKNFMSIVGLAIGGVVASAGCSSGSDPTSSDEPTIGVTSVVMNADGTQTVRHYTISQAHYTAMVNARRIQQAVGRGEVPPPTTQPPPSNNESDGIGQQAQATISTDSCTDGNALWIYDQSSCPSSPDYILCLLGSGTNVSLHNWYDFITGCGGQCGFDWYWDTRVQSFWPGNDTGAMLDNSISYTQTFSYGTQSPFQGCTAAGEPTHMDAVTLN